MGAPGDDEDIFQGIDDPWSSDTEAEAVVPVQEKVAVNASDGEVFTLGWKDMARRVDELAVQRWDTAQARHDDLLLHSSMISCMPLPTRWVDVDRPCGYSATWGLEVTHWKGNWRVRAACDGFQPGDVVERCCLLPLQRPEDDDVAICRYMSLWTPDITWTKESGEKMPELRAEKLAALRLEATAALKPHRLVHLQASFYPLGYAHLYADAAEAGEASAEVRVVLEGGAPFLEVVALREIRAGEEVTVSKEAPKQHEASGGPIGPKEEGGAAACSGHVQARPSELHGRGVFATASYAAGQVVELCPALVLDSAAALHCADYAMSFGGNCGMCPVLALGCGALYNHASGPNAKPLAWVFDEELQCIILRTTSAISCGDELVIDYGEGYWGSRGLEPAA